MDARGRNQYKSLGSFKNQSGISEFYRGLVCLQAMENRQLIDELKAHNDKLQRDVYALVSGKYASNGSESGN